MVKQNIKVYDSDFSYAVSADNIREESIIFFIPLRLC